MQISKTNSGIIAASSLIGVGLGAGVFGTVCVAEQTNSNVALFTIFAPVVGADKAGEFVSEAAAQDPSCIPDIAVGALAGAVMGAAAGLTIVAAKELTFLAVRTLKIVGPRIANMHFPYTINVIKRNEG